MIMSPTNDKDTRAESGEMDRLIGEFITYLSTVKNYSPRTLPSYRSTLSRTIADCNINHLVDITPVKIDNYFAKRLKQGKSQNSNSNVMIVLRAFLIFCNKRGYTSQQLDMYEVPRRKLVRMQYVTADEVNRMLNVINRERDRLILLVLYTSGCRVSELLQLSVENLKESSFSCIAKGGKEHVYYFDPDVADAVRAFIAMERIESGPVFRMTTGKPIGAPAISHMIKKATVLAKISHNVHPHQFRHGFATASLENGADVRTVQEMLGHSNIQTTMRYMHVTDKRMQESYQRYAPKVTPVKTPYWAESIPQHKQF